MLAWLGWCCWKVTWNMSSYLENAWCGRCILRCSHRAARGYKLKESDLPCPWWGRVCWCSHTCKSIRRTSLLCVWFAYLINIGFPCIQVLFLYIQVVHTPLHNNERREINVWFVARLCRSNLNGWPSGWVAGLVSDIVDVYHYLSFIQFQLLFWRGCLMHVVCACVLLQALCIFGLNCFLAGLSDAMRAMTFDRQKVVMDITFAVWCEVNIEFVEWLLCEAVDAMFCLW